MMKKLFLIFVVLLSVMPLFGQENVHSAKYTLLLTGASFASPENGWFELGCESLDAVPVNRAVGAEAIANTANLWMSWMRSMHLSLCMCMIKMYLTRRS